MKPQEGETQPLLSVSRHRIQADSTWRVSAACLGFLADSYDLFTIDLVVLILQLQHGELKISAGAKALMVSAMLAGVLTGQLGFGYVADWMGRKWAFVATAALTVIGALSCSLCQNAAVVLQMSLCRFVLGVGVGGEYPLSATVTAEALTDADRRGQAMALVVSMQGVGMLMSALMAMMLVGMSLPLEAVWRLLLAFGSIPSTVAFCMRWSLKESAIFERSLQTEADDNCVRCRNALDTVSGFWPLLIGTSSTWLLMNMFAYSLGSFKSMIFDEAIQSGVQDGVPAPHSVKVFQHARFAAFTSCFAIAGFGAGLYFVTVSSRFSMQLYGFLAIAMVFFVVAGFMAIDSQPSLTLQVGALGFMFLCLNAGPNLTTYIVPAEVFPTSVRARCHGVSAASGKMGAFIGTALFPLLQQSFGMGFVYSACGVLSLMAALLTFYLTPRDVHNLAELDASSGQIAWKQGSQGA